MGVLIGQSFFPSKRDNTVSLYFLGNWIIYQVKKSKRGKKFLKIYCTYAVDQARSDPSRWKFSSQYLGYWGVSCHIWRIIRVHQYSGSIYNVQENLKSNYENKKILISPDVNIRRWIDLSGINRRVWRCWKLETSVNMAYPRQVSPCSKGPDGSYNCECSNLIIGNFQCGLKLLQSLH